MSDVPPAGEPVGGDAGAPERPRKRSALDDLLDEEGKREAAPKPAEATADARPAAAPAPAPEKKGSSPPTTTFALPRQLENSLAGVKDTVESIIIALILAFTFRAFVVEAFVIPTGSMGPTLDGAHFRVICPRCGLAFDEGTSLDRQLNTATGNFVSTPRGELFDSTIVPAAPHRYCPNCGYKIDDYQLPDIAAQRSVAGWGNVVFPWANNGDRILVLKYLYSFADPHRWDVIVFKEPMHAQDNYIKRLIGLPGETVEVIEGDVFITPPHAAGQTPVSRIARKPPTVETAMLQVVYDNDHYPIDANQDRPDGTRWTNPWAGEGTSAGAWDVSGPVVRYNGPEAGTLLFHQRDMYLYNVTGYNNMANDAVGQFFEGGGGGYHSFVGDLDLECDWTPSAASSGISMTLGTASYRFRCSVQNNGTALLEKWDEAAKTFSPVDPRSPDFIVPYAGNTLPPPAAGHAHRVVMRNIDHQIRFWVDGTLMTQYAPEYTREMAKATPREQKPTASIDVAGPCSLAHLKLLRDVYYTQTNKDNSSPLASEPGTGVEGHPALLGSDAVDGQHDEFFAMGDNSTESLDSRMWAYVDPSLRDLDPQLNHYGRIPRRYMLGRAFFVYWPAGFRPVGTGTWSNLLDPPLIPNAGKMRFIR